MAITIAGPRLRDQVPVEARERDVLLQKLGLTLCDVAAPMGRRFDALFELKALGGSEAITWISKAFSDRSELLKHELAYVLGQLKDSLALPVLFEVLGNMREHPMVRHEAGEAIGAIGKLESMAGLESHLADGSAAVRETCELAIARIKYENTLTGASRVEGDSPYDSIDPAPPDDPALSVGSLKSILLDRAAPLFKRYRALFALRNEGTTGAVEALAEGFGDTSILFKHEIAYVFGQMRHEASIAALTRVLRDKSEDPMVRHECAEALGSIGGEEALGILREHENDESDIVSESCVVGLSMGA